jgi:hypothetical protein
MNCAECRDNLIACAEGLLDHEDSLPCRAHLETCPACRTEFEAIASLQQRLIALGQAAAGVSLVGTVMERIRREEFKPEKETLMSKLLKHRWSFGLSAAAAAAIILLVTLLTTPKAQAKAAEVMTRGAQAVAKLVSVHLSGQLRTLPADNFSYINSTCDFCTIQLWKQFSPELKWRTEKPGRVVVMDGQSTIHYIKPGNVGVKLPQRTTSAFDTDWLHRIANLSNTISNEVKNAVARGWKLDLAEETTTAGKVLSVVTVHATSGLPENDYLKNSFLENADTRRVYRFDTRSELLDSVQIYLARPEGETLIFDLNQIEYNQAIDPGIWELQLPANINWYQEPQKLPDNDKYTSMTAEQAARAFFEACSREDWKEAGKFISPLDDGMKQVYGGLEIVSLGDSYTSKAYGGRFVPYEIKLRAQAFNIRVTNTNRAKRCVLTGMYDSKLQLQQDFKWDSEPEVLPDNDVYARLSPKEAVQTYFDAQANLNWGEMRKFTSAYDVETSRKQIEMVERQGLDVHKVMPVFVVGEAAWVPEQSAWFVKCHAAQVKKWNVAVRKDNPAGRWQMDGGL